MEMLKKYKYPIVLLLLFLQGCVEQTTPQRKIYNSDFKWTITIPENFEKVSAGEWAKFQNKGTDAIEKTFDEKVINQAKTIFVFKNDQMNYIESNYQPFDTATDGNYQETCWAVNNMIYETFKTQMPDAKIDTTRTVEKIDNLQFQVFKMKVLYPNKMILHSIMYSRLFGKKEFSVNIIYSDTEKGNKMLNSWTNSTFGK